MDIVVRKSGRMFPLFRIVSEKIFQFLEIKEVKILSYNKIENLVLDFLKPIVEDKHLEIWDIEFKKEGPNHVLRVFLDKEEGISIDDCEQVSRELEAVLDEKDPIPQAYMLEVSSAGLDRLIKYKKHFEKCMGKNVDVKLFAAIDGKKEFTACLSGYDGDNVEFNFDGETKTFPLNKISSIRLSIEF